MKKAEIVGQIVLREIDSGYIEPGIDIITESGEEILSAWIAKKFRRLIYYTNEYGRPYFEIKGEEVILPGKYKITIERIARK